MKMLFCSLVPGLLSSTYYVVRTTNQKRHSEQARGVCGCLDAPYAYRAPRECAPRVRYIVLHVLPQKKSNATPGRARTALIWSWSPRSTVKVENCVRTSQRCRDAVARYGPIVDPVSRNKLGASTSWCIRSPVREDMVILLSLIHI